MPETKTVHYTYRERVYLSRSGHQMLDEVMRKCARLYNADLDSRRQRYMSTGEGTTLYDQFRQLTGVRDDDPEYNAIDSRILRGALARTQRAFDAFFRRVKNGETPGYPRFKSSRRWRTLESRNTSPSWLRAQTRSSQTLKIKGLPTMRIRPRRKIEGRLVRLSITRYPTGVYASITCEVERAELPESSKSVGIHMGVAMPVTAEAESIERGRSRKWDWGRIASLQRRVSRCEDGSRNKERLQAQLARLRHRQQVSDVQADHRYTTKVVRDYGVIYVDDLEIVEMTKRGKRGNVNAKARLNRSILEQGWGRIRQQLEYKAAWAGREFKAVDPRQFAPQTCRSCSGATDASHVDDGFECASCGIAVSSYLNAAVSFRNGNTAVQPPCQDAGSEAGLPAPLSLVPG